MKTLTIKAEVLFPSWRHMIVERSYHCLRFHRVSKWQLVFRTFLDSAPDASSLGHFILFFFFFYLFLFLSISFIIYCNYEYKSFRWILCLSSESSNGRWSWRSQNSQLIPGVRVNLRTHNVALSNWCSNVIGSTRLFDICNIHLSKRIVFNTSSTSYTKPVTYTQASKLWIFFSRFFE